MQNQIGTFIELQKGGTAVGNKQYLMKRIMEQTAMHPESFPGHPIVEITGERRVLIENHRGIAAYEKGRILVNVKFGMVCVCGSNLEIIRMTKEQLVIYGCIDSVGLQRRR